VELADGTSIVSSWLVGADGMHSMVRDHAGIPFTGAQYPESFMLADIRGTGGLTHEKIILHFSPAGMLVLAPLPGGIHRVVATLAEAPEHPAPADVQALLDTRGPQQQPAVINELIWGTRFRVHHRVAGTYRRGRVLLAGDSAHVHSPAGGQGMNTGIQDAVALADALTATLDGDESALDRYDTVRRDVAHRVLRTADALTRLATMRESRRRARNLALSLAGSFPPVPRRIARQLSGLAYRQPRR
jgi:2-polyprenyl-6-methoxyphenol hydroxylase-like FAD-dependent oxidoreductase